MNLEPQSWRLKLALRKNRKIERKDMNRLMTFRRQNQIPDRAQLLNQRVLQRQAVARYQGKSLFQKSISCLSEAYKKVTDFFSSFWKSRKFPYTGELDGVRAAFYVNSRGGQEIVEILGFVGISKAIVRQWNGVFKRSVYRLHPLPRPAAA